MGDYGRRFYQPGDLKVTLNFVLMAGREVDAQKLLRFFPPDIFLIKITPLNPTYRARQNDLSCSFDPQQKADAIPIVDALQKAGYQVIVSIGELEENKIGSNCGQYLRQHLSAQQTIRDGYTYPVQNLEAVN